MACQTLLGEVEPNREDNWVFGDKHSGQHLSKFSWNEIERHTLIKGWSSSDDPNLREHWKDRYKAKAKELTPSYQKIAKKQEFVCPMCSESLFNGEEIHKHQIIPQHQGGKDTYSNPQLVHLLCYQQIHSSSA